jgi:predicted lysophospholipase L1 biosynthesis ABC-type transport system permease subunit
MSSLRWRAQNVNVEAALRRHQVRRQRRRLAAMVVPTLASSTLLLVVTLWSAADRKWWAAIPGAFIAAMGYVVTGWLWERYGSMLSVLAWPDSVGQELQNGPVFDDGAPVLPADRDRDKP